MLVVPDDAARVALLGAELGVFDGEDAGELVVVDVDGGDGGGGGRAFRGGRGAGSARRGG